MSDAEKPETSSLPFDERRLLEGFIDTVRSSRADGRDDDEAAAEAIALVHTFILQAIVTEQSGQKRSAQQMLNWHCENVILNAGLSLPGQSHRDCDER